MASLFIFKLGAMKSIYSLLAFLLLFVFSAQAQTDLKITAVVPQSNTTYDTVATGQTLIYKVAITNLGPSTLNYSDTVIVYLNLDWVIPYPGYVYQSKIVAGTSSIINVGQTDTISFSLTQGISLGQTPDGPAIVNIPNHVPLNSILFGIYGYTSSMSLLNDPGASVNTSGSVSLSGNNVANPQNVIYGNVPTNNPQPTADLQITNVMPASNMNYPAVNMGDTVNFKVAVKNNGPDALNYSDTVKIEMELDWLIPFTGYVLTSTNTASSLNLKNPGGVDTITFSIIQGVSLGQTPDGPAVATIPNNVFLNDINFRIYGYTTNGVLIDDIGATIGSNGSLSLTGNNIATPQNVIFGGTNMPSVTITADNNPGCETELITFTATVTNPGSGGSYEWYVNNSVVGSNTSTFSSQFLSNNNEVQCKYTSSVQGNNVEVMSNTIVMSLLPAVSPSIQVDAMPGAQVSAGTVVNFLASISNGGNNPDIQWTKNQNVIANASGLSYTATAGTDFQDGDIIQAILNSDATCANPPTVVSAPIQMQVSGVGIDEVSKKVIDFNIVPNPNQGNFMLNGKVLKSGKYHVSITNILGQVVYNSSFSAETDFKENIQMNSQQSGIYQVVISNEEGQFAGQKIVIIP